MEIKVDKKIQEANDVIAERNRAAFAAAGATVFNLISSPGAGKTTLLIVTLARLMGKTGCGVIEGDVETDRDAQRLAHLGLPVAQITTAGACHLDANMIATVLADFPLAQTKLLFIENVGNLVCPASYDLGERGKIVLLSVPEGDDKPAKYPLMFHEASVMLINKMDLIPYVDFDLLKAKKDARALNRNLRIIEISCKTKAGLPEWIQWLTERIDEFRK